MIVRIMEEGQRRIADSAFPRLEELDEALLAAVEKGDEQAFRTTFGALLAAIRELGEPLPDDSLEPSDLILPEEGASLEEVRGLLTENGLLPN
ncbi:hypothetical protein ACFW9F_17610 [Streptomyces sp. NPDC059506]|uniref:PspA-associated protein PspAA n=1 Tax=Streptomyces TaxID=1883 RepID=UPI000CAEF86B|nr:MULTISPECIES: hypothetical protein [unclassified Streptomyces]MCZ2524486.1 hypothetical protein [Streptomyces sp. HB2AG]PLW65781.1 hypothetical protein C0036_26265 [Streptomyces sp. DJ]QMV23762.1 hypothetical protein GQS52_20500 [Streptomyces sp. SCUT-3]